MPGDGAGAAGSVRTVAILNPRDEQIGGVMARASYTWMGGWGVALQSGYTAAVLPGEGVVTGGLALSSGEVSYEWDTKGGALRLGAFAGASPGGSMAFATTPQENLKGTELLVTCQISSAPEKAVGVAWRGAAGVFNHIPTMEHQIVLLSAPRGPARIGAEADLVLTSAAPLTLRPFVRVAIQDRAAIDFGLQIPFFWQPFTVSYGTTEHVDRFRTLQLLLKVSGWRT